MVRYLAEPLKSEGVNTRVNPHQHAGILLRGDVLLTAGNSRAAGFIQRLTRSSWSHVSMYVGHLEDGHDPRCIIEADIPIPVVLPTGTVNGLLTFALELGESLPTGQMNQERLELRLKFHDQIYRSDGKTGWFEDEMLNLQANLRTRCVQLMRANLIKTLVLLN